MELGNGVIALMRCTGIKTWDGHYKTKKVLAGLVTLECIYSTDESMREYADASPMGKLEIQIDNPEAMKQFTAQKYYTIKIEESDES